ncbi:hypothetical protein GY21_04335 [Cryobacterium roopkundense]|uniref:Signal transduction histidine kinase n=1 Tax=Cryobacterium roopkundense TaxID=1001240 RepID=A0A099JNF0_9MICO|nr:ATP-binding protein [Cryobacterium roopkundense]KGJ79660.1 hypothetical protein GY21_04335 [Cryobacterium roopkundense]MBB5642502.1 signal transduction histidine kinase [Cryobacterium roopkundense]
MTLPPTPVDAESARPSVHAAFTSPLLAVRRTPSAVINLPVQADGARDRLTRMLYLAVGGGAIIFGGLSIQPFLAQAHEPALELSWTAWLLVFGLPLLSAVLSRHAPLSLLRRLALLHGLVFIAILVGWLILGAGALPQELGIPWVLSFTGIPCVAVAVAERGWVAWSFIVLACTLSGLVRAVTTPNYRPALVGVEDGLYSLLLISVFAGFTLALRRSAGRIEAAARLSRAADAGRAARTARTQERQIIDALVHDSVISTLLVAGLGRADPAVVARQAATTIEKLDALSNPTSVDVVLRSGLWLRLSAVARDLAPDVILRSELHLERLIPVHVGDAVVGAVGEALRNSMAAAGVGHRHPVIRRVTVRPAGGGIQVLVADDGAGFDPALVPQERLGIAQSIVGRMHRIAGGAAVVRSRPGQGTEVLITWIPATAIRGVPAPAPARAPAPTDRPDGDRRLGGDRRVPGDRRADARGQERRRVEPDRRADSVAVTETLPARDRRGTLSLSGTLGLSTPLALAVLVLFVAVHALLAFADSESLARQPLGIPLDLLALVAVSAAALWITLPAKDPFPPSRTFGILVLCSVTAGLMYLQISPLDARPFAHWHLGAVTLVLVVLVARGRTGWAWVGYAALAAATVAWTLANGLALVDGVNLVVRHGGTLLVGTLFAMGMRRSGRTLLVLIRERGERASSEATSGAVVEEREVQLARVNALARPALTRLMSAHELDDAERAECLLVEGSLRDAIRGRSLFVEPIITATRNARTRGVEVTLLDDSGDNQPTDVSLFARLVADQLDALSFGRFTLRLLPVARAELATIVVESAEHRMLVVDADGTARDA